MRSIPITSEWIHGAVSLETTDEGIRPWRLPHDKLQLFAEGLVDKSGEPAGVRVAFTGAFTEAEGSGQADSTVGSLELGVVPDDKERLFDLVVDDKLIQTFKLSAGEERCSFHLPAGGERFEIYLPLKAAVILKALHADKVISIAPYRNDRFRWLAYGSSITQCVTATSPSLSWPAIVARNKGWDLTCLGYGGQCHIEPMVARVIGEQQVDIISLCLGINVMSNTLNIRTFRSAVIGMIELIREKHATTPLVICSPIYCSFRESTENDVGMTLEKMREEIRAAISILRGYGDANLLYVDGLDIFGEAFAGYQPDQLHPNAEGYQVIGARMTDILTGLGL